MKWLKICGITGLLLVLWMIVLNLFGLIIPDAIDKIANFIAYIIPFISVLILIFYVGFIILGKYTKSKLLEFSSIGIISFIVLLVAVTSIITKSFSISTLTILSMSGSILSSTGLNLFALFVESTNSFSNIFYFSLNLLIFALVVVFSIGLIIIGKDIKFAKITGILNIIYAFLSATSFISLLTGFATFFMITGFLNVISSYLPLFVTLFGSLALLNASKKFKSQ